MRHVTVVIRMLAWRSYFQKCCRMLRACNASLYNERKINHSIVTILFDSRNETKKFIATAMLFCLDDWIATIKLDRIFAVKTLRQSKTRSLDWTVAMNLNISSCSVRVCSVIMLMCPSIISDTSSPFNYQLI